MPSVEQAGLGAGLIRCGRPCWQRSAGVAEAHPSERRATQPLVLPGSINPLVEAPAMPWMTSTSGLTPARGGVLQPR
jgi:hypothetical protein